MTERRWTLCEHGLLEFCIQCELAPRQPLSERRPLLHDALLFLAIAAFFIAAAVAGSVAVS